MLGLSIKDPSDYLAYIIDAGWSVLQLSGGLSMILKIILLANGIKINLKRFWKYVASQTKFK